jgi:hypothetical protein
MTEVASYYAAKNADALLDLRWGLHAKAEPHGRMIS